MERVISKTLRKKINKIVHSKQYKRVALLVVIVLLCLGAIGYASYMQNKRLSVNQETYTPLLQLIAKVESKDNYNAYFGNATNQKIDFTNMSIGDVMKWQQEYIDQGNYSSAVGRYQIVNTTLDGLVRRLDIDTSEKFDRAMQDKLAITLLERRGSERFVNDELTKEEFAANLAMEWAALPRIIGGNPSDSYYANDGVNKALVEIPDVLSAIDKISPK